MGRPTITDGVRLSLLVRIPVSPLQMAHWRMSAAESGYGGMPAYIRDVIDRETAFVQPKVVGPVLCPGCNRPLEDEEGG